ncbi:hypothetical protein AAMO2058_001663100 [Amorphochlora amoebiformis]
MGSSLDWSKQVFTLDPKASEAVSEAFVRLHDEGLIYRANRLVNWCPKLNTALSDIETSPIDLDGAQKLNVPGVNSKVQFGRLERFAYKVEGDPNEELVVATTRPETLFGDTAVAIHPDDGRYSHLHGKALIQPLTGRRVPVVLDSVLVDPEKGTGAVKVTPGHDSNDFACGERHGLEIIEIMRDDGSLLPEFAGEEFGNVNRLEAREGVLEGLKSQGLYRGGEDMPMRVTVCSRSGDVIEPRVKMQWFLDTKDMAAKALEYQRSGDIELIPRLHTKTWTHWLNDPHPWCISRQLWWGHRIPAYFAQIPGKSPEIPGESPGISEESKTSAWVVGRNEHEARIRASKALDISPELLSLTQEEDVLDTWFSSGLFPLVCFGWPNDSPSDSSLYPLSVLETGSDILFFWVARMVMLCSHLHPPHAPFSKVFLHPMVRDSQGRKMSKSLGNVVDPLDLIQGKDLELLIAATEQGNADPKEKKIAVKALKKDFPKGIPECGTDGLRFSLAAYMQQGEKINLDIHRVQNYRFLCNKLWQATRFTLRSLTFLEEGDLSSDSPLHCRETLERLLKSQKDYHNFLPEQWILAKFDKGCKVITEAIESYSFGPAANALQGLMVSEFCDVYIEFSKPNLYRSGVSREVSVRCLFVLCEGILRLMHPFMPFVTEELWQRVIHKASESTESKEVSSIMVATYPIAWGGEGGTVGEEIRMEFVLEILSAVRNTHSEFRNHLKKGVPLYLTESTENSRGLQQILSIIQDQVSKGIRVVWEHEAEFDERRLLVRTAAKGVRIGFELEYSEALSEDLLKCRKKLMKVMKGKEKLLETIQKPEYDSKVPEIIRQKHNTSLETFQAQESELNATISDLESTINRSISAN